MTTRKDVKPAKLVEPDRVEAVVPDTDELEDTGRQPLGRVIHDDRGNAVWKWAGDTSPTGTTSGILKYIDPRDLKVEGQGGGSGGPSAKKTRVVDAGGGYDPYNQGEPRTKTGAPKNGGPTKR